MAGVNDVYRLTLVCQSQAEPILTTYYYRISAVGTGDERQALINGWNTNNRALFQACVSVNVSLLTLIAQAVKPVGPTFQQAYVGQAGTIVGGDCPTQVAAIITRKTAIAGKGGRGRIFMGPVPLSNITVAQPDITATAAYTSFANGLLLSFTNTAWTFVPVLWRRKLLSSADLTTMAVNNQLKTRRSRAIATRFHRRKRHTVGSI